MPELKIYAKTYYGNVPEEVTSEKKLEEFDSPEVPVVARRADGVRVVLGTHDFWDYGFPDIQIERRPGGWVIFLHPVPGDDPSGYVYFLDDGRSYFQAERTCTKSLQLLEWEETPPELDQFPPSQSRRPPGRD